MQQVYFQKSMPTHWPPKNAQQGVLISFQCWPTTYHLQKWWQLFVFTIKMVTWLTLSARADSSFVMSMHASVLGNMIESTAIHACKCIARSFYHILLAFFRAQEKDYIKENIVEATSLGVSDRVENFCTKLILKSLRN